jgi:hypothetical protein
VIEQRSWDRKIDSPNERNEGGNKLATSGGEDVNLSGSNGSGWKASGLAGDDGIGFLGELPGLKVGRDLAEFHCMR